jgi:hypothetical protein
VTGPTDPDGTTTGQWYAASASRQGSLSALTAPARELRELECFWAGLTTPKARGLLTTGREVLRVSNASGMLMVS